MALFPRWTNTVARLTFTATLAVPALAVGGLIIWARTPFVTGERLEVMQPVQFDHRHHSWEEGIDCRYCHASAEVSPVAGIPPVSLCMGCHDQVWNKSPRLEPVRQAFFNGQPIPWAKVHDLPDFVYFDHSIHLAKGVGCVSCHGRVDQMPVVRQVAPLTMQWCLDCHRDPGPHLRPKSELTNMRWQPDEEATGSSSEGTGHPPAAADGKSSLAPSSARDACDTCHR
jgi:hypothetical protein